jgi:hypothetical protein
MMKALLLVSLCAVLSVSYVEGFPIEMQPNLWTKGTLPANHYVNISQISTPYGDGMSVNTIGYPGAFESGYDFFAYYIETFVVPPEGRIFVSGYFRYNDNTPHIDRKYLAMYLLNPDLSGYIATATRILDYAQGHAPGTWYYRNLYIPGLTPGREYRIAFGRGDLCDMERMLEADWAAVEVVSSRVLEVPSHYSTIHEAIEVASAGDIIQVAAGTYHENLVINKDSLRIIGEDRSTTIIYGNVGNGSAVTRVNITGRNVQFSGFTVMSYSQAEGISINGKDAAIFENNVADNAIGIGIHMTNSRVLRNNIYGNLQGIWAASNIQNCTLYSNSFYNNIEHVYYQLPAQDINSWDNGCAGNFWNNSSSIDNNGDGIDDNPHIINVNNIDRYPLMHPFLLGDVNHDGKVDIQDLARVSRAFGSYPGHQEWNPYTDINEDGKIDIQDLARTSANFGWHE